jgi:hypothetical protein
MVLADDGAEHARIRFERAFPGISSVHTPIWALTPAYLKMIDNTRRLWLQRRMGGGLSVTAQAIAVVDKCGNDAGVTGKLNAHRIGTRLLIGSCSLSR